MPVMPAPTINTSTSTRGSPTAPLRVLTARIVPTGRCSVPTVDEARSARAVPYAMEFADRVPKRRYYDAEFYELEAELLWPRVWQMACRLEEIPQVGDFVEYEFLDQSTIVLRIDDTDVRAFQNACRHRGVKVIEGR